MLLGDAKTRDERGRSIEKTEHRVLNGYRMVYEGPANRRRAGIEAFGWKDLIIRESEERPLILHGISLPPR